LIDNLNYLDIAALAVITMYAVDGLLKGFVLSVFNIAGFLIAIYISRIASISFAEYIKLNTGIDDVINNYITEKYNDFNPGITSVMGIFTDGKQGFENTVTSAIILILSFILIFFVIKIILSIVANMLDAAARLPVIKHFNRIGGFIFGALKGAIILYIFFAVITIVMPFISSPNIITTSLDSSVFASNFYKYNIVIPSIKGKLF